MKILVTNHWLKKLGGSETFTYTLATMLYLNGHEVDVFTNKPGIITNKLQKGFGIKNCLQDSYDLILASHKTCVEQVHGKGFIIQTCHGTIPKLEQPNSKANVHVAVSDEVKKHLQKQGIKSKVILNGINCQRFKPVLKINNKCKRVLSLAHSDDLNSKLKKLFQSKDIEFVSINKFKNPVWSTEKLINQADMVISLGRGTYEAMACGRPVLVLDHRKYQEEMGDGILLPDNIKKIIKTNCSGRTFSRLDLENMVNEAIENYNTKLGDWCREYALKNLNMEKQIKKYLQLYEQNR